MDKSVMKKIEICEDEYLKLISAKLVLDVLDRSIRLVQQTNRYKKAKKTSDSIYNSKKNSFMSASSIRTDDSLINSDYFEQFLNNNYVKNRKYLNMKRWLVLFI